jgi:hypothetical protein
MTTLSTKTMTPTLKPASTKTVLTPWLTAVSSVTLYSAFPITPHQITLYYTIQHHTTDCHKAILTLTLPHPILPYPIPPLPSLPYAFISCPIFPLSYHGLFYPPSPCPTPPLFPSSFRTPTFWFLKPIDPRLPLYFSFSFSFSFYFVHTPPYCPLRVL